MRGSKGFTTMEALVAMVLLSAAAVGVSTMLGHTRRTLRAMELSKLASWELENARVKMNGWSWQKLTKENIEGLPVAEAIKQHAADARWRATVEEIQSPIHALQITLALEGTQYQQPSSLGRLTFWVIGEGKHAMSE